MQNFICIISLSYSLYDLIACTYYGLADSGLYIHHILCLIGFFVPLYSQYGAVIGLGGLFCAEISNLPRHIRVILRNYGLRYTKGYEYAENIYIGIYVLKQDFIWYSEESLCQFLYSYQELWLKKPNIFH